ncbi:release factor glutamine methyltransferase [Oxobacter pfennigii]|uniref:Release factor glutamine methyltransferase n=1 Tax=Oxobacter pfennigii TaxID=36849 RepID=A0A0P8WYB0_9CLOT|nr:class I SAM-dependent methyltransferase [Oxobacter pfennigii]KPU43369.1 release factor glutamine methyltransferase [Oxobacter pfennigii]
MNFDYFDKLWNSNVSSVEESRNHWDFRAKDFNSNKSEKNVKQVVSFFLEKGMLHEGCDAIDIGCGAGKYAIELSQIASNVTALDISPKMLEYAKENAEKEGAVNIKFLEMPWEEVNVDELGWNKKFDFAAAIMSPAINSRESLEKLMKVSKGYCFMSGHLDRHEKVMEDIERIALNREPSNIEYGKNIYLSFNTLWIYGIHAEITYHNMDREITRTLEDAFNYYCAQLQRKSEFSDSKKEAVKKYLEEISEEGFVKDTFKSKNIWMYWKNP